MVINIHRRRGYNAQNICIGASRDVRTVSKLMKEKVFLNKNTLLCSKIHFFKQWS